MRGRLRQEILGPSVRTLGDVHATVEATQYVADASVLSIDHRSVEKSGVLIDLFPRSEVLLARQRPHGRETHSRARRYVHGGIVMVARGDGEGITLGMNRSGRIARATTRYRLGETFVNGRHGEVVVEKLSELHYHQSVSIVQVGDVGMNHRGDYSGIR